MRSGCRPTPRGASRGNRRAIRCKASGETTSASWLVSPQQTRWCEARRLTVCGPRVKPNQTLGRLTGRSRRRSCAHSRRSAGDLPFAARASAQAPPIKPDQPLPMPLRGGLVVAPALREGKAVMDAEVELDLAGGPGPGKQSAQFVDHRQGRQRVMLGAGDVELPLDLAQ